MPVHAIDKPLGLTSHDVVARARRLLGTRRVGHAGTLDPLASGVLLLLSGEATKLSPFLTASAKEYLAWVAFGLGTPTLDAEPPPDAAMLTRAEPHALAALSAERLAAAAAAFLDLKEQRPPAFSAIRQAGQRSYAAARAAQAGGDATSVEPPARPVAYHRVELLAFAATRDDLPSGFSAGPDGWGPAPGGGRAFELPATLAPLPCALFRLEVAAGTYIRSFARDLGASLAAPAHLAGLVRVRAGAVGLGACSQLADIATAAPLDPVATLPYPHVRLDAPSAVAVRHGKQLPLTLAGTTVLLDPDGRVAAVVEPAGDRLRYLRVWQAGLTP